MAREATVVGMLWASQWGERAMQPDRDSDKEGGSMALSAIPLVKYSGYHPIIMDGDIQKVTPGL